MADVKQGDKVQVLSTYRVRGFKLATGEKLEASFEAFDRGAHEPMLIQLHAGDLLVALSDSQDGQVYVEGGPDGARFACILIPDTFQPK